MTTLYVEIDGKPVPLNECGWLERRPCGCIVTATVAVAGGRVLATAEQVQREWRRTKRERDKAAREGLTTELITMKHYREDIGARWECADHTPKES